MITASTRRAYALVVYFCDYLIQSMFGYPIRNSSGLPDHVPSIGDFRRLFRGARIEWDRTPKSQNRNGRGFK
jgi:hypothetical protein